MNDDVVAVMEHQQQQQSPPLRTALAEITPAQHAAKGMCRNVLQGDF